jgi:hypothetical protein
MHLSPLASASVKIHAPLLVLVNDIGILAAQPGDAHGKVWKLRYGAWKRPNPNDYTRDQQHEEREDNKN